MKFWVRGGGFWGLCRYWGRAPGLGFWFERLGSRVLGGGATDGAQRYGPRRFRI